MNLNKYRVYFYDFAKVATERLARDNYMFALKQRFNPMTSPQENLEFREKTVAEALVFCQDQFGPQGDVWRFDSSTDLFWFTRSDEAFVFRLRWA
ncbi:MAG: hypothetical protein EOP83_12270 [Verrucomicrobiaceae bacterium]|nr:MAG: hypothetical protein EOP83_12270 [Verrucomicrobiaceae bacterium]